jgi:hypothetical protein
MADEAVFPLLCTETEYGMPNFQCLPNDVLKKPQFFGN